MKNKWIFIISTLLLAISSFSTFLILKENSNESTKDSNISAENPTTESTDENIKDLSYEEQKSQSQEETKIYHVSANLVWWDQSEGFNVIKENSTTFTSVSPFWYSLNENGSLNKTSHAENQELIKYCKDNKILILPTFTNGHTPKVSSSIFNNQEYAQSAITNIIKTINAMGYDGLQLDFENLEDIEEEPFTLFIEKLNDQLNSFSKTLIVTVSAKTSDKGTTETNKAQNWSEIAKHSDFINIMAYDYHWSNSSPGEIAPISWITEVLEYGTKIVAPEKILLGVNFYGYDWVGNKASALEYTDVIKLLKTHNLTPNMTSEKEKQFTYQKDGHNHIVYYSDHDTLKERLNIVVEYEIAGIAIWRMGHEDPKNFSTINNIFNM